MNSIVIIDSGIDLNFKEFNKKNIEGINIDNYRTDISSIQDFNGHGTACAAEILRINTKAKLYIIKLLNENAQCTVKKLIEALDYAASMEEVKLISLSCSTKESKYNDELKKIIRYINEKNKLLICSAENDGEVSYPSYMEGVIGVRGIYKNIKNFWFDSDKEIQSICCNVKRLLPQTNGKYSFFGGNSRCTAYFCGVVSRMLADKNISNEQLTKIILNNAERTKWTEEDLMCYGEWKVSNELEIKQNNLLVLSKCIEKFSDVKLENIKDIHLYGIIGLENIQAFIDFANVELNKNIDYTSVTSEDFYSVYTLYDLVFKEDEL
ncbi:S8/S53 family peptidase [Clostridium oryzae]|uniref:Intracellular serine protease n=1 Tax=Clostridium oryzae TaxID=1450648 RepID=A0A1V4IWL6_9CLOT|nr:S8/S53 family peptidase [Clostridium oryzae]OPJ64164.1 intracellular serine protease [Clostridium oryzae]